MSRRSWIIVAVVVALVAVGGPAGYIVLKQRSEAADRAAQKAAASSFAAAWKGGTLASLSYANGEGAAVGKSVQAITGGLTSAKKDAPSEVVAGDVTGDGETRTVKLDVSWKLAGDRVWTYPTELQLQHTGDRWLPKFEPKVIHPRLTDKAELEAETQQPKRGEIIGANDKVLVTNRPAVLVGLEPSKAEDVESSAQEIASIVDVDPVAYAKRAKAASPNAFVDAILLRKPAYDEVSDQLDNVPGLVVREQPTSLGPTADFARALIGRVGQATAEIVEESKGRVRAGDTTGISGLQRQYDKTLAGTPGLSVTMVTPNADGSAATDNEPQVLFSAGSKNGTSVHITLDQEIQNAADKALLAAKKPAALVAIRVGTGDVLAVANGGPNANGYNRAFLGQYPPGSTFKVITTLGMLSNGLTAQTPVKCPATINVSGRTFKNFEDEVLGNVPFRTDFALSCNTAFISQADRISSAELAKTAKMLGYGQKNKLGVDAYTGSVPSKGDAVSHAAAMIGQGTVLASPVTVAGASAGVAAGTWHAPRLVIEPDAPAEKGVALPASESAELKKLMRAVVTNGTGTSLKSVPGGPVYGKTGTAEYGNESPPRTHAWITGFQGDIAFAVVVEDGEAGGKTAGPLAKSFLTQLAR